MIIISSSRSDDDLFFRTEKMQKVNELSFLLQNAVLNPKKGQLLKQTTSDKSVIHLLLGEYEKCNFWIVCGWGFSAGEEEETGILIRYAFQCVFPANFFSQLIQQRNSLLKNI